MPANALLAVQPQDVSLEDAQATVIAEQKIEFAGKQVPLPFELHYGRARIDRTHTLGERADNGGWPAEISECQSASGDQSGKSGAGECAGAEGCDANRRPETLALWYR